MASLRKTLLQVFRVIESAPYLVRRTPPASRPCAYSNATCRAFISLAPDDEPEINDARAQILDGRKVANEWQADIAREVEELRRTKGIIPGLAVVLVGDRADSLLYVKRKQEACTSVGFNFFLSHLSSTVTQDEIQREVKTYSSNACIHGVLIQVPLPAHICEAELLESIDPSKDVDGFHPLNVAKLVMRGHTPDFVPCTPRGCAELLTRSGISVKGLHAVVLGNSNIVGLPFSMLLRDLGAASVMVVHNINRLEEGADDHHISSKTREADVVVAAVGKPHFVRKEWIKPGAIVFDVGINPMLVPASGEELPQHEASGQTLPWVFPYLSRTNQY
ncbi:hypothetical protein CYMTET_22967 [Cymbomonas tetramitiformis]|uniref:methenyltetrahydrofolate cyclohydrolase n=1 Tax=Cymbomonas tetramitiformis TaxID=36881 RepID=A0AAE0FZP2_9CHLO|nr:hypothetical protein CYMTET_22967 [Cymbomonas tetramitiformis]